jgi:hypothetical protein
MIAERIGSYLIRKAGEYPVLGRISNGIGRVIKATVKPDYLLGLSFGSRKLAIALVDHQASSDYPLTIVATSAGLFDKLANGEEVKLADNFLLPYLDKVEFKLGSLSADEIAALGRAVRRAARQFEASLPDYFSVDDVKALRASYLKIIPLLISKSQTAANFTAWADAALSAITGWKWARGMDSKEEQIQTAITSVELLLQTAASPESFKGRLKAIDELTEKYRSQVLQASCVWWSPEKASAAQYCTELVRLTALIGSEETFAGLVSFIKWFGQQGWENDIRLLTDLEELLPGIKEAADFETAEELTLDFAAQFKREEYIHAYLGGLLPAMIKAAREDVPGESLRETNWEVKVLLGEFTGSFKGKFQDTDGSYFRGFVRESVPKFIRSLQETGQPVAAGLKVRRQIIVDNSDSVFRIDRLLEKLYPAIVRKVDELHAGKYLSLGDRLAAERAWVLGAKETVTKFNDGLGRGFGTLYHYSARLSNLIWNPNIETAEDLRAAMLLVEKMAFRGLPGWKQKPDTAETFFIFAIGPVLKKNPALLMLIAIAEGVDSYPAEILGWPNDYVQDIVPVLLDKTSSPEKYKLWHEKVVGGITAGLRRKSPGGAWFNVPHKAMEKNILPTLRASATPADFAAKIGEQDFLTD